MTARESHTVTWKCDRCGHAETKSLPAFAPAGWREFSLGYIQQKPLVEHRGELCGECQTAFRHWLARNPST